MKYFDSWNRKKKDINGKNQLVGLKERDIVFIHMGVNVGYEQNGKGEEFLRPVVVLRVFNRNLFFGVPLTSQKRDGSFFVNIKFKHNKTFYENRAIIAQSKTFDTKRVKYKKGMIIKEDFEKLKDKFYDLTLSKEREPQRELEVALYHKNLDKSRVYIHNSCYIDDNVTIGNHTKIWHFSHILSDTTIGENCSFGQNSVVGPKVKIGNGVKVQNNISIYEGVEIEDDVFLGPSMVFTNVINPRAFIQRKDEFKKTLLKKGCSIGANATIICGVTIGEYALIGSGAVINRDVKPYALMVGVPARQIGWVGVSGNSLEFNEDRVAVDSDGRRYAIIGEKLQEI